MEWTFNYRKERMMKFVPVTLEVEEVHETSTHMVKTGMLSGLVIERIQSKEYSEGHFLVAKVLTVSGETVWSFQEENFRGRAFLVTHENSGKHVIALINPRNTLERIIFLEDLGKVMKVVLHGRVSYCGGQNPINLVKTKISLARQLEIEFTLSPEESLIYERLRDQERQAQIEKRKAELQLQSEMQAAKAQRREEDRRKKIQIILSREKVVAYGTDGTRYSGVPVVSEEWPSLPEDNTPLILVEVYDAESGEAGNPVEFFYVNKGKGGK